MLLNARPRAALVSAALLSLGLVACQTRHPPGRLAFRGPPPAQARTSSTDQLLTVAFARNAVQAMALGSEVAALNNLDQAIGRSQPLQGRSWVAPRAAGGSPAPLDANAVNTLLISAKAKLLQGDFKGASAKLKPIVAAAPPGSNPAELLFLRASGSLGLAQAAAQAGRLDEAGVELEAAASQLRSVTRTGSDRSEQAGALARRISASVASPSSLARLSSGQFAAWTGQVDRWLGGPSSGATLILALQSTGEA